MNDWDTQINDLFLNALEQVEGAERVAYLDKACGDDTSLRRAVEEMLAAHEKAGIFLEVPAFVPEEKVAPVPPDALDANAAAAPTATGVWLGDTVEQGLALGGEPPLGSRLGNFQLLALLGKGGMGIVYEAKELNSGRVVALKLIRPDLLQNLSGPERESWLTRFRAEAQAVASLDHPHIVTLYEVGEFGEVPYFSMKRVKGKRLQDELRDTSRGDFRTRQRKAAMLLSTIARAVHHAHQRGILHRDLKPANILLDEDGQPLVTDFGVAKRIEEHATLPSGIVGTPAFMAPEQAAARKGAAAVAADVYSLGAILYALLTGQPPFKGQDALALIFDVINSEPRGPRELEPQLDRDLEIICLKCLHKEPGDRYGSATALAEDLDNWLASRPINARPVGRRERVWRWCRQNPVMASLTGAVFALAIGIAVVSTVYGHHLEEALEDANRAMVAAQDAQQAALRESWAAYLDKANALRTSGRKGQRFESLKAIKAALKLPVPPGRSLDELRNAAIAALCLPDIEMGPQWDAAVGPHPPEEPEFRQALEHKRLWELVPAPKYFSRGNWLSSDQRFILAAVEPYYKAAVKMRLWRLDGPKVKIVLEDGAVYEEAIAFRPDSRQVALGHPDGTVTLYDTESGKEVLKLKVDGKPFCLAYHPCLPRLAVASGHEVVIFDLEGNQIQRLAHLKKPMIFSLAWRPDGRQLAVGCEDMCIYLWDVESGRLLTPPWKDNATGIRLSWNQSGDRVVSNNWWSQLRLWDARTGRELFHTLESLCSYNETRTDLLCPLGNSNKMHFLRIAEGRELRQVFHTSSSGNDNIHVQSHPDGCLQTFAYPSGLGFLNLASGAEVALVPLKNVDQVEFDGTGAMWTINSKALYRWPVRLVTETLYEIGPPEQVVDNLSMKYWYSRNRDGTVLAFPQFSKGTLVVLRNEGNRRVWLQPQYDVRHCVVSPDGQWVATMSWWPDESGVDVKIWEAATGRKVKDIPNSQARRVAGFSPDGRWFVTSREWPDVPPNQRVENHYRVWEVGTWKETSKTIPTLGEIFWDKDVIIDGQLDGRVSIIQLSTSKELARLSSSDGGRIIPHALVSGYLLGYGQESGIRFAWDLPLIRRQLAEMGLDWDGPPYFTDVERSRASSTYSVHVDAGSLAK
jgi:eukaryotic-like serine/threonine-protein kinase